MARLYGDSGKFLVNYCQVIHTFMLDAALNADLLSYAGNYRSCGHKTYYQTNIGLQPKLVAILPTP